MINSHLHRAPTSVFPSKHLRPSMTSVGHCGLLRVGAKLCLWLVQNQPIPYAGIIFET